jgi:antitoxin component YwqK of YwqJK toxin-antitoxin module
MDKIGEIKKLKELLDSGLIKQEEFDTLKKEVLNFNDAAAAKGEAMNRKNFMGAHFRHHLKFDEIRNRLDSFRKKINLKNEEDTKNTLTKVLLFASLIITIIISSIYGAEDGSILSTLTITTFFSGLIILVFLLLKKITPVLMAVALTFLIPLITSGLLLASINVFSSFTYNPKIKKVVTYHYVFDEKSSDYKEIPEEVFFVRIEGDGEDYYAMKRTGRYRRFDEAGKLITKGKFKDGIRVGKWFMTYDELDVIISYDKTASTSSIEAYRDKLNEYDTNSDSWANDILLNNKRRISTNGYINPYFISDEFAGICHGKFKVFYKGNLFLTGQLEMGFLDGRLNFFNPKGKVYKTVQYDQGKPVDFEYFPENLTVERLEENLPRNQKRVTGVLFNGNYHGDYKIFDEHGGVVREGYFVDGNEHGESRNYGRFCGRNNRNCTYQITYKAEYFNGHLHGLYTSYWSNVNTRHGGGSYSPETGDVINYTYNYSYGKKHGTYTKYDGSRTRRSRGVWYTEEYRNGEIVENSRSHH